ncbi:MKRN2 opposite strand protein [Neocloeon triangulifer]|uniref:MKRN2 opposite strand protein n=1 Tax=Neocloeon triangulifer TaxID=2078957 RepID=UPI00286F3BAE|nr:MKRN2 opposite strand protein [Neocloeon triangulifer]
MNRDPGLICFKHCKSDVFVFSLPEKCPECELVLSSDIEITPVRIPFPFSRASQHPCSLVLRPTNGDFLRSYSNNADLHIGVTNSKGQIFSYDEDGLKREPSEDWNECLSIQCFETFTLIEDIWDGVLEMLLKSDDWTSKRYHEDTHNCYTFILHFLGKLPHCNLQSFTSDRKTFCEKVLIPQTVTAGKYISLFRRVSDKGCYVKKLS